MRVQKLMNYDQMVAQYRNECRDFWLKEFPIFAAIGATIVFGVIYGMTKLPVMPGATPYDGLPWWAIAFLVWTPAMAFWAKMMLPDKPHPDDVLRNRRLRWQHGMDSSVDEGN